MGVDPRCLVTLSPLEGRLTPLVGKAEFSVGFSLSPGVIVSCSRFPRTNCILERDASGPDRNTRAVSTRLSDSNDVPQLDRLQLDRLNDKHP